ncbi:hypothetical protein [Lactococcus petauri]|jgi:hypothetical protein|uniref:hypothetical protein n=1 Tax=Lactococcus petauri TaxID=1940789 RepID=UPI00204ECD62|nr:hypothetical protein [Lactococcus petauri]MDT2574366.1 hypothetical protein [Lactococcus petauri]DAQ42992.1 MAG TPA: hypothetical protein [Caudoviricetes sp.]
MSKFKVETIVKQRLIYKLSILKIRIVSLFNKQLAAKMIEKLIEDIGINFKKYFHCKVKS